MGDSLLVVKISDELGCGEVELVEDSEAGSEHGVAGGPDYLLGGDVLAAANLVGACFSAGVPTIDIYVTSIIGDDDPISLVMNRDTGDLSLHLFELTFCCDRSYLSNPLEV